ncbi:sphinganine C4-monooxygenase 2-like [Hibiscus syriacus]|uniref:sphinganine C4-monooxygenase 2-like n=1 Tax=Hibiscus syriacus TaxID=106335 RepID=UPI001923CD9F|nr:sphinganine C4-monooxygenase 2-like [Hibiscus syriacus]
MALEITKEMVEGSLIPIVVYWVYSGLYTVLGNLFNNYRLHPKEDGDNKNLVSKGTVIRGVLRQQFLTTIIMNLLHMVTRGNVDAETGASLGQSTSLIIITRQIVISLLVYDTYQYFVHRWLHQNKFLYKHLHSKHHRLVVNYAYGAFYSHPLEGFLFDIIGSPLAVYASGMSPMTSAIFSSISIMKSVDDHSGFWIPWNPFQFLFKNNVAYHDVHHQLYGGKYNFAQPFFPFWDKILGTYMDYRVEKRGGGGFKLQPIKESKD